MPRAPNEDTLRPSKPSPKFQRSMRSYVHSEGSPPKASASLKRSASLGDALDAPNTGDDHAEAPPAKKRHGGRGGHLSKPSANANEKSTPSLNKAHSTGTRPAPSKSASSSARMLHDSSSVAGKAAPGNPRGVISQLVDALEGEDLLVMFVGVNPGIRTAETGHAYAHRTNLYWRLLHASGLTPRLCQPSETHALVPWLRLGNTNLVARATKDASTLTRIELDAGVTDIEEKARRVRARVVCLVGKGIWEAVERVWRARAWPVARFKYGFRPDKERMGADPASGWPGSRVFVATTTSALAANMKWEQKLLVWKELGDWVAEERKREEKAEGKEDEDRKEEPRP